MTSPEDGRPTPDSPVPHAASSSDNPTASTSDRPAPANSPESSAPATTQLPRVDWTPPAAGSYEPPAGNWPAATPDSSTPNPSTPNPGNPDTSTPAAGGWTPDQTRDFSAYQPQSYPTYPPTHSPTTELPPVSAGGAPPSSAAAYPGPAGGASAYTASSAQATPVRRGGAGFAGAVAFIGLCGAAAGAFALPVQQFANSQNTYFGSYRDLSVHKLVSSAANDHSVSIVGGHIATDWWRYGVFAALGVLAVLLLVQICVPVLRRVAGVLLFLGGLAAAAGFLLGAHQTNDYSSVSRGANLVRITWRHLAYGFWVAVAGCVVVAVGGLIAAGQSTRR